MFKGITFIFCFTLMSSFSGLSMSVAEEKQIVTVNEQDEAFKKSVAKVIFFLSLLGTLAYFLKKHNMKGRFDTKLSGAIKLLDETSIRGTKFTLLEILDKKVLVATNNTGSLNMMDLKQDMMESNHEAVNILQTNRANSN